MTNEKRRNLADVMSYLVVAVIACVAAYLACGCDPTEQCHSAVTRSGVHFTVCAVDNGTSYIKTEYGDVDCIHGPRGYTDCDLTAQIYVGEIRTCIEDVGDAMYAYDNGGAQ